ncbi:MAG: tRNA 2-thiouridine(34) synthase MnmA [Verrucomicrobia bacterium]|nr:tRNA 2-thiouridine(34) synthase MnmA [Verrucomicrobiota bacterium]
MKKRVVVGMSGGVDSSIAAALLQQQGCEVFGMTLVLAPESDLADETPGAESAARSAQAVCSALGIEWRLIEQRELFVERVIRPFYEEYTRGRTPNPCVVCNRCVKFPLLIEAAQVVGAEYVATGHYARVGRTGGRFVLRRGLDESKDQSYVLFGLDPAVLPSVLMPLGEQRKSDVRRLAAELDLPVQDRPASQDACFVPDGHYGGLHRLYADRMPQPGPIYNLDGNRIGEHKGVQLFTVGQRRGLGVSASAPLYVVEIDAARNALIVGPDSALDAGTLIARCPSWISIDPPQGPLRALIKIRYNHAGTMGTVSPLDKNTLRVDFDEPVRAITPGQACVFYDGDLVLGGAWIEGRA